MYNDMGEGPEGRKTIERLKELLKDRTDSYEIFYYSLRGMSVEAKDGAVDALKVRSTRGVGLRVVEDGRLGFSYTSVFTEDALQGLVEAAIDAGRETGPDSFMKLPAPEKVPETGDLEIFDDTYHEAGEEEIIRRAVEIEKAASMASEKIKRTRKATYGETLRQQRVVSSEGVDAAYEATFFSGHVTAVAEADGEAESGWEIGMSHRRADLDPRAIGRAAARDAIRKLGARKIKTVRCPAVFENTVVCELLESLASSFLGDNVCKKRSMLAGRLGRKIASPLVNIYDDGLMKGGWATSASDGEGLPRRRTPLVTDGVLEAFLYDSYWARRAATSSTGNSTRQDFKALPGVGISNLYMERGGSGDAAGLMSQMEKGLLVTELMGVHTINPVTGDFSLGAAGHWVEKGRAAYPVRGMAVAGNLLELFSRIGAVADDLRFIGSIGAPAILVNELEASGI